jgi:hypothetical protein
MDGLLAAMSSDDLALLEPKLEPLPLKTGECFGKQADQT